MTITLNLQPEIEQGLRVKAQARGVSLADYVGEIIEREAAPAIPASVSEPKNLAELFENSPFRGLNMKFERDQDYGREIEL